jgi:hypothetical protein
MSSIRDDYDAITVARRRERTLWLWTVIAAVFGWGVILVVALVVMVVL